MNHGHSVSWILMICFRYLLHNNISKWSMHCNNIRNIIWVIIGRKRCVLWLIQCICCPRCYCPLCYNFPLGLYQLLSPLLLILWNALVSFEEPDKFADEMWNLIVVSFCFQTRHFPRWLPNWRPTPSRTTEWTILFLHICTQVRLYCLNLVHVLFHIEYTLLKKPRHVLLNGSFIYTLLIYGLNVGD